MLRIDLDQGDTYVVPLRSLAEVTRGARRSAPLSRRYTGTTPGKYLDIEGPHVLSRPRPGAALVATIEGRVYSIAMRPLLEVVHGERDMARVSMVITDAAVLDCAGSRQATLGAWG
jgi:hypothetical protein